MNQILVAQYLPSFLLAVFVWWLLSLYLLDMRNVGDDSHLAYALAKGMAIWASGYGLDRAYWGIARITDWQAAYSSVWPVIFTHLYIAYGLYVIVSTWAISKGKPHYCQMAIGAYFASWAIAVLAQRVL